MKRLRLDRWASQLQPPRNPRLPQCLYSTRTTGTRDITRRSQHQQIQPTLPQGQRRYLATTENLPEAPESPEILEEIIVQEPNIRNAPSPVRAAKSAKLAALHARLSLPPRLPLRTLARCLIDASVDTRPSENNSSLAVLGQDLLGYYTAEWLMCHYPRLPMPILFAAQYAYVGSQTLAAMRGEWGVEVVAAPGPEVDPGLLQLRRVTPGNAMSEDGMTRVKDAEQATRSGTGRRNEDQNYRRGMSSRIVYDDQFGDLQSGLPESQLSKPTELGVSIDADHAATSSEVSATLPFQQRDVSNTEPSYADATTLQSASASFVRALTGALYLHAGSQASKNFHKEHVLSRHLPLHTLFNFTYPTRDLSRLCKREGFEPPVARLISETGRLSISPVYIVGVYSGDDKLGEGAGSSLNEARVRAAAAALRSWYLYSPPESEITLPSDIEGVAGAKKRWQPQMIDSGEIIT